MIFIHLSFAVAYIALMMLYVYVSWPLFKTKDFGKTDYVVSAAILFIGAGCALLHIFVTGIHFAIWGKLV